MAESTQLFSSVEKSVLLGNEIPSDQSCELGTLLVNGDYEAVLQCSAARAIFGTDLAQDASISGLEAPSPFDPQFLASDIGSLITALVKRFINEQGHLSWAQITLIGAACLHAFVETNWTGPELRLDPAALLPKALAERWVEAYISIAPLELPEGADKHEIGRREQLGRVYLGAKQSDERKMLDRTLVKLMEADGEEAYDLTPRPLYLYLARLLLVDIPAEYEQERDKVIPSAQWWAARTLLIQQSLLDYPAQSLLDQIIKHFEKARKYLPESPATELPKNTAEELVQLVPDDSMADMDQPLDSEMQIDSAENEQSETSAANEGTPVPESDADDDRWNSVPDRELWARFLLELGVVYSQHSMPVDAKRYITLAQAASGLQWKMTGAKGKRTRFQQFDVTQLVLLAQSTRSVDGAHSTLPEAMALNDDVLLENIKFSDDTDEAKMQGDLNVLDKCILLAFCLNVQNENPAHGLTSEQMMPFVTRVLQNPTNWSVYTMGLLLRSRLESNKMRTVERATLQMQQLVDQITHPLPNTEEAGAAERLHYLFALSLPSQWTLERELATMFMGLGVIRSALDIFERLQMWDDVISCYALLGQPEVAEKIVHREMEEHPDSPKLWCILGDFKKNPEHWRHAWEISGQRYARAMRSLGAYHFDRSEFAECVDCYEKAVHLNPMSERSWYMLGCAAMKLENWSTAAKAFLHVVSIDENNGESWNNLASVYLQMGDEYRIRALRILSVATKFLGDSWQVWSNLLHVSLSMGMLPLAIQALGKIIDLRVTQMGAECLDLDALRRIISLQTRGAVFEGLSDAEAESKRKRLNMLTERLLVKQIEARITSSAPVWRAMADYWFWRRDFSHCLDCYIKAYRCISQLPQVAYAPPVFKDAVSAALDLVSMYENLGSKTQVVRVATTESGDQQMPSGEASGDALSATPEPKMAAVEQPICADWKHKAKMLLRGLIGKCKESFEGTPEYTSLTDALNELRQA
ncbi:hypothetical protein IWW36_000551 [Coemansia brasiliensis]|uniref:TPR-like protein n=1 Tax=Coemansia brasiliensis TaxID=2650707 RepID=A0A9W8IB06_9FUNG|nr:hypothetical protein IWW36_000551 [Coemansia brasiliensis]